MFGDDDYSRECSDDEGIILEAPRDRAIAERVVVEGADRDTWFVGYAIDSGLVDAAKAEAIGTTDARRVAGLAWAFDPLRPLEIKPEPEPQGGAQTAADPDQTHCADDPTLRFAGPAPNSRIGRSPAVTLILDGDPHEHLQQDQVRYLW